MNLIKGCFKMTFEQYIAGMSTRELVGQLLCPAVRLGVSDTADPREYFDVSFKDPTVKTGSVFFWGGSDKDLYEMVDRLKERMGHMPLIAMDMETSPGALEGGMGFGSAMSISAANSTEDAYACGEACARIGLEHGVTWSFGPAIDINYNPKNPIMNTRCWGDSPECVSKFTTAFINGMQENGMIATAKHFPGDGMDDRDQHLCTTINSLSMDEWRATYGKVWKAAIDNGLRAVMPGHIALPAYEKDHAVRPATLSSALLQDLLRGELGFDGLIVSDGMNMGGLAPHVTVEEGLIGLVKAGVDVLLFVNFWTDVSHAVDVLEDAVNRGEITLDRVKESVYRIWKEKERLGIFDEENTMLFKACPQEKKDEFKAVAERITRNSLTIAKNDKGVLPLDEGKTKRVISVDVSNLTRKVDNKLDAVMREKGIEVIKYGDDTENGFVRWFDLPEADALIVNFYYSSNWGANDIAPCGEKLQRVYEYFFRPEMPVVVVCHGNPFIPFTFPYMKTVVNTYTPNDPNPEALYNVIFGLEEAKGVSPVRWPDEEFVYDKDYR